MDQPGAAPPGKVAARAACGGGGAGGWARVGSLPGVVHLIRGIPGGLEGRVDVGRWVCRLLAHAISAAGGCFLALATEAGTRVGRVGATF